MYQTKIRLSIDYIGKIAVQKYKAVVENISPNIETRNTFPCYICR